jgi:hypothetical protein
MDHILPKLYKDYGEYSNYRNFPLDLDGLKPVERRVLLSAYTIARNKLAKSRQVDSYTTGHFHPHGECYGTIVQLVKQGFLIGQGNYGSNVGVEPVGPAAPRYTECKIHPNTVALAFKHIKYAPKVDTELNDVESLWLPTMFPICLMGTEYTQGIGFGYKTYIPCYTMSDLHKRLMWLLGHRKTKPTIAPITDCKILASKSDLEQLLTTGKAKIEVEGIIEENPRNNTVTLKSWPPGKRFESFLNKFSKELEAGLIGFTDLSVYETKIVFQVLRERNRDKIFKEFINKLNGVLKGLISFEITVVDTNKKVYVAAIDDMLLNTYNMFWTMNDEMIKDKIAIIDDEILWMNTLLMIRPSLSECLKTAYDIETAIDYIAKESSIERKYVEELLNKYRIKKLLTLDTDTSNLNKQKKELSAIQKNLDPFVLDQYEEIKKCST